MRYAHPRSEIDGAGVTDTPRAAKNPHDIFINLHRTIEIVVCSKKLKAVVLLKWLTRKG